MRRQKGMALNSSDCAEAEGEVDRYKDEAACRLALNGLVRGAWVFERATDARQALAVRQRNLPNLRRKAGTVTYWQYWHLTGAPFQVGTRDQFYRGHTIEEAIARLEFICSQRRHLATLLGPAGVGKTTLLNFLASNPPRQANLPVPQVALQSLMGLASGELPQKLGQQLTGFRFRTSGEAWTGLNDFFAASARGISHCLMLIDDVENCGAEAENDLVRLVRVSENASASIVLSIESHLASTVSRWLLDRSFLQVELVLWDLAQTRDFIRSCLARCGRPVSAFTDAAVVRLHELSKVRRVAWCNWLTWHSYPVP